MAMNNGLRGTSSKRDVMNYAMPQGPRNISDTPGPGIHGSNFGNCGSQGPKSNRPQTSGMVGIGGDAVLRGGTQGKY